MSFLDKVEDWIITHTASALPPAPPEKKDEVPILLVGLTVLLFGISYCGARAIGH